MGFVAIFLFFVLLIMMMVSEYRYRYPTRVLDEDMARFTIEKMKRGAPQ